MNDLDRRLDQASEEVRRHVQQVPLPGIRQRSVRRRRVGGAIALGVIAVAAVATPLVLLGGSGGEPGAGTDQATSTSESPAGVSFGEPAPVATAPGEVLQEVIGVEGVFYASLLYGDSTYQVVRSTDDGSTWETLLEADPDKREGPFAAGEVVILVINDNTPARDTMAPSSVVSEAPSVLVFDPATGATSETILPRPVDPEMEGLSLDEPESCDLGGYQSWISARDVAAGDRLVVTGSQYLVGRLAGGTVICDVYRNLTWTSDDRGATWELHDSRSLGAITWTGTQYVAWSKARITGSFEEVPDGLVVSADGIDWTAAVSSPPIPDGSIPAGTSLFSLGDTVIAWAGVRGWTAQVPDDVTDPEQLREVLGISDDMDVEQVLETIGVDLPLDAEEAEIIARFNGFAEPRGALIAVSNDDGLTWAISYVAEPVIAVVGIGEAYIALTSNEGVPGDPSDDSNSLLTSTDGVNWTHAIDLPGVAYFGPESLTATEDAVYIHLYTGEGHAELWRIPVYD